MHLYKKVLNKLIKLNISVSVAESCTGGLLAYSFTKNKNASKIFKGGYISYSNEFKVNDLGVKKTTLKKYGAVSKETAKEMVKNLYLKNKTNICISTTGIAGPKGGTKNKPIGLVYIGIFLNSKILVIKKKFIGTRIQIQTKCINFIFKYLDNSI
ncbi:MAG: damage-inducible protein CinA [Pelagibacteraceae bacterium]|nr:damage-inducible protein CinA [Pelagibacteraceae bacterium]|tara:strand:- start:13087 stop:13551 length:465 start_codon:yes stop_codon:yes gene_type:complete